MKNVTLTTGKALDRRTLLRAAGVSLALPVLEAMTPAFAAEKPSPFAKRFVGVSLSLGMHSPFLVPQGEGTGYVPSPYLKGIQDIREDFTVVSGVSHPGVTGGHNAEGSIFSACPNSRGNTSRNTISLDQLMANRLGHETRFPSLVLNTNSSSSPSYTENGSMIPAETSPAKLFTRLFVADSAAERKRQVARAREGQSILDLVAD
ncbi:MAG: DUF1552 domain-containing protein, partial [Verrucomicrobiota bacterium]